MDDFREGALARRFLEEPLLRTKKRRRARPSRAAEQESFADVEVRREAVRIANHRSRDRHRLDDETIEVLHDGRRQAVTLVNVSGGGAMIEGAEGLRLWDEIELNLGQHGKLVAAVRWVRGNRIGLEFAQETRIDGGRGKTVRMLQEIVHRSYPDLVADLGMDEDEDFLDAAPEPPAEGNGTDAAERDVRHSLIWSGHIHYDHDSFAVRLRNISEGGALIECARSLPVGAELLLELDKAGSFFATVNWVHGDTAGLRFHKPFDLQCLAAARPAVAATRWVAPDYLRDSSGSSSPWAKQCDRHARATPRRMIR
nr:PilZ domain-containing protein [uncultured Sphingomonas sp.]